MLATQLRTAITSFLLLFWSLTAYAAQATFVGDLRSIPPVAVAISLLLSLIGGAAYTASKIASPNVTIKNVPAEIVKDVLTSIVVGFVTFCLGSYMEWPAVMQAGLITLAGYGGSRVLEPMLAWALAKGAKLFGAEAPALPGPTPVPTDSEETK
jgi:hypothetical protein